MDIWYRLFRAFFLSTARGPFACQPEELPTLLTSSMPDSDEASPAPSSKDNRNRHIPHGCTLYNEFPKLATPCISGKINPQKFV